MDNKARAIVRELVNGVNEGTYAEKDVLCLLVMLRETVKPDSPVRELADFIVHREKDRGSVYEYLQQNRRALEEQRFDDLVSHVLYEPTHIVAAINEGLGRFEVLKLDMAAAPDITFCVMSLLQDIELVTGSERSPLARLALGFHGDDAVLYAGIHANIGLGLVVLSVANRYLDTQWRGTEHIIASPVNGYLLVSFVNRRPIIRLIGLPQA